MIADLLPLLAFVTVIVIARNVFEAHILNQERRRLEARELVRMEVPILRRARHQR